MKDFYLDGVAASSMGLCVEEITPPIKPANRQTRTVLGGLDGYLLTGDKALVQYVRYAECFLPDRNALSAVYDWIHGSHDVRFSNDPDHVQRCDSVTSIEPEDFGNGYELSLAFVCQPFRYHYPEAGEIVLTAAGTVNNPGTALSLPRIKVEAEGDFMLMIGGELIEVTGGSIIIDSDLYDCYSADGALLANSRVRLDEYPVLLPGPNAVSWSGAVSSVAIIPRWRDV